MIGKHVHALIDGQVARMEGHTHLIDGSETTWAAGHKHKIEGSVTGLPIEYPDRDQDPLFEDDLEDDTAF